MMMTSDVSHSRSTQVPGQHAALSFDLFTLAFSKAWYKLTHRMGPKQRYLPRPEVTIADDLLWQDPLRTQQDPSLDSEDVALKGSRLATGLSVSRPRLRRSPPTYRDNDKRRRDERCPPGLVAAEENWVVNRRTVPVIDALRDEGGTSRADGRCLSPTSILAGSA
jgi:catalase-peroxidase